jgi:hypothetical protein
MWNGKKDKRVLLRVSEEMCRAIHAFAELHHRSIQDESRFLMGLGLDQLRAEGLKDKPGPMRQLSSTRVNSRQSADEEIAS